MEKIEFLAISAPIWALVLCGISGFLLFIRFSFGKLTFRANLLLLIMIVSSIMSCDAKGCLGLAVASYLLPGAAVFLLCWGVDLVLLYISWQIGRRDMRRRQQKILSETDSKGESFQGSEYF